MLTEFIVANRDVATGITLFLVATVLCTVALVLENDAHMLKVLWRWLRRTIARPPQAAVYPFPQRLTREQVLRRMASGYARDDRNGGAA